MRLRRRPEHVAQRSIAGLVGLSFGEFVGRLLFRRGRLLGHALEASTVRTLFIVPPTDHEE